MLTTFVDGFLQLSYAFPRMVNCREQGYPRGLLPGNTNMIAATTVLALLALLIATEPDHSGSGAQALPDNVRRPTRPRRDSRDEDSRDPCRRAA
jgi:hypothetical protein